METQQFENSVLVFSQSIAAFIEAQSMLAANVERIRKGESLAYPEEQISELINKYGLGWNSVITILRGEIK